MQLTDKKLLVFDGLGAFTSAILLGIVLVRYQAYFGMPLPVLYFLSAIALLFSLFSIGSALIVKRNYRKHLRVIALANITYCSATSLLVILYFSQLTILGVVYFAGEIILVLYLASLELKKSNLA
jgi:hypothetical protein